MKFREVLGIAILAAPIFLIPRIGTASPLTFLVGGQLTFASLVDHFGLFRVPRRELSWLNLSTIEREKRCSPPTFHLFRINTANAGKYVEIAPPLSTYLPDRIAFICFQALLFIPLFERPFHLPFSDTQSERGVWHQDCIIMISDKRTTCHSGIYTGPKELP